MYITSTRLVAPKASRSLHLSVVAMPQFSMDSAIRNQSNYNWKFHPQYLLVPNFIKILFSTYQSFGLSLSS